jgi:hypothetical protein
MYKHVYIYSCEFMRIWIHICLYMHSYVLHFEICKIFLLVDLIFNNNTYVDIYTENIYIYIYIYICIHIYIYIYTYSYICFQSYSYKSDCLYIWNIYSWIDACAHPYLYIHICMNIFAVDTCLLHCKDRYIDR